jgi:hypothetical protein
MESFLNKHLSLANKNNIIRIVLGNSNSTNVFNTELDESTVKRYIKNTKGIKNKIRTYNYTENTYYKGNEEFILRNNETTYLIKNYDDYLSLDNKLITKERHDKDEYIVPNYKQYDNIDEEEILEIMLISCFTVRVKKCKSTGKSSIELVISKPNKVDKIMAMISQIEE